MKEVEKVKDESESNDLGDQAFYIQAHVQGDSSIRAEIKSEQENKTAVYMFDVSGKLLSKTDLDNVRVEQDLTFQPPSVRGMIILVAVQGSRIASTKVFVP